MELQHQEFRFFKEPQKPISLKNATKNSVIHLLFLSFTFSLCISVGYDFIDLIFNPRIGFVGQMTFGICYIALFTWNASMTFRSLRRFCQSGVDLCKAICKSK